MRYLIVILLLFLFDSFVFQAFATLADTWSAPLRYVLFSLFWIFPIALLGLMFISTRPNQQILSLRQFIVYRATIIIAYVSKLLVAIVLGISAFVSMLLNIYVNLSGQQIHYDSSLWMIRFAVALGGFMFSVLIYGMLRNRYRYRVFREEIAIPGLPSNLKGLKIVQISDIHSGSLTEKSAIEKGIELINKEAADLVCFTGDLVNNVAAEMNGLIPVFKKIKAKYGTYSILGNHDYGDYMRWDNKESKMLNFKHLIEVHRAMGWELLLNENRLISINGSEVALVGVENYSAHPRFSRYGNLSKATEGLENADLKLLLSHDPSHWNDEVTTKYKDIDITLSGHTHGGQFGIEIGSFKWSPVKYYYKQWIGLYREGTQYLYVNRGFGFLGYPGRVGILPEITVLVLK